MTNTMDERAVIYARYSSHNQQEQSIEGQIAAAKLYAQKKGYTIVHEYCDRAKTGTNDNRAAFQQMLRDCSKHQFSVIIVWKVDRFGRNREEIALHKHKAKKHGVRVEYVAENISEGPEGIILESVLEGMAEYFSVQLSQNVKRGLLESAKKHQMVGGYPPLGFRAAADKTYEIDPETAPIVREIFDMYAKGSTEFEIISELNQRGLHTRRGVAFNRNSLKKLLKNERYIGTYVYKDIIHDEDAIPAIVDKDTFRKVQEMLKVNRRMPSHKWSYSDYLLTGKAFCGKCGSAMIGMSGTGKMGVKYCYYICMKKHAEKTCDKSNIRQDILESVVLENAYRLLDDPKVLDYIIDKTWEFYQAHDTDRSNLLALKSQLEAAEKGIANLTRSVEAGMPFDLIKDRLEELRDQKTALGKAIAEEELSGGIRLTRDYIQFFLERFKDADHDDRTNQKRMVDTFINSVYVFDDHITIAFNYSGDNNTITVSDIKKATTAEGFDCGYSRRGTCPADEPSAIIWYRNVFLVSIYLAV